MYLIFDTETTGLPKNWRAPISDTENWPRCVQLAWQVHDEIGNLIESKSYIIKPDNFDIPYESEKIHGISTLLAEAEGIELDSVLNEFNVSISKSKFIIGHNVNFDFRVLRNEFSQIGKKFDRDLLCTIELSKKVFPDMKSYSLGKLVSNLGIKIKNRHRADGDAKATLDLFILLKSKISQKELDKYIKKAV